MRTVRSSPIVSTSPAFTAWPGALSRTPLMRTWPASTSAAALVRAFTTRACHNHLSRRWRSKQHHFEDRTDHILERYESGLKRAGERSLLPLPALLRGEGWGEGRGSALDALAASQAGPARKF